MGYANDGLRFLLEVSALAALAYWGFEESVGYTWRLRSCSVSGRRGGLPDEAPEALLGR
jgi:Protein of unknown function (DUF2568)